jgi:hypothetical protein
MHFLKVHRPPYAGRPKVENAAKELMNRNFLCSERKDLILVLSKEVGAFDSSVEISWAKYGF